jgi:adenylate cyclase
VVFCDLRGFTAFAETVEPEDVMVVLAEFHGAVGDLVHRFEGTLERFTGDGVVVFFNDPIPCEDAPQRAMRMAVAIRSRVGQLAEGWRRKGYDIELGIGIAQGHATLGRIGFEGRYDYGAIGNAIILASRLSGDAAAGEILVAARTFAEAEEVDGADLIAETGGDRTLKGFSRAIPTYLITGRRGEPADAPAAAEGAAP